MSEKLTSKEYLEMIEGYPLSLRAVHVEHYGDLRAKEAVERFARELIDESRGMLEFTGETNAVAVIIIKHLAKQHGVEL